MPHQHNDASRSLLQNSLYFLTVVFYSLSTYRLSKFNYYHSMCACSIYIFFLNILSTHALIPVIVERNQLGLYLYEMVVW